MNFSFSWMPSQDTSRFKWTRLSKRYCLHHRQGLYCYLVMLSDLKNIGATNQRLVNLMSSNRSTKIWKYKSTLDSYKMKLNLAKCAFGGSLRKFLGFMVSKRGIEANHEKIDAILHIAPPTNRKELQNLTKRVIALCCFISSSKL